MVISGAVWLARQASVTFCLLGLSQVSETAELTLPALDDIVWCRLMHFELGIGSSDRGRVILEDIVIIHDGLPKGDVRAASF